MANGSDRSAAEEIDRMTATLAASIDRQSRELREKIEAFGAVLERVGERLRSAFATEADRAARPPAGAPATPGTGAAAALPVLPGIVLVKVINDSSEPVPVRNVNGGGRTGGGGRFQTI